MNVRLWWRDRRARRGRSVEDLRPAANAVSVSQVLPAGPVVYGRNSELAQLSTSDAAVRLVSGHPGVGKSGLLAANVAFLRAVQCRSAVSNPLDLEYRSGALQAALLESLGVALAGFEGTQSVAERWGRVFSEALERTSDAKARDLIRGATAFMNGVVRARLGDPAADALEAFEANVMTTLDEQLSRRIEAAASAGAVAAFTALAEQVALVVGEPVVLTIDRAERLSDDDFRLLLDLIEAMPDGVHVNLGHTNRHAADADRIQQIVDAGSAVGARTQRLDHLALEGLLQEDVSTWMAASGLNPEAGDEANVFEVMRVTAGYPLHVDLVINAIQSGQRLGELTGDDALLSMMRTNYLKHLTADDQHAVMLLTAFSDRPTEDLILAVLGMDGPRWSVLQQRLVAARFLVTFGVEDKPWFHELGRRLLWDRVLSSDQREHAARSAISPMLRSIISEGSARISQCIDLARLAAIAPDEADGHPGFPSVMNLHHGHLTALGALLELADPEMPGAFVGDIVDFARQRFPPIDHDLFDAAQELEDFGIAVVSSNDQDSIVVPYGISPEANVALIGRIAGEIGRVPIRALPGELLRGVLIPSAGTFREASMAPGYGNLTELARSLSDREWDRSGDAATHGKYPGLIIRPRLGHLDLSATFNFNTEADRDRAFDSITARSGSLVFGETWNADEIFKWPQAQPLQEMRFASAASFLTGARFDGSFAPANVGGLRTIDTIGEQFDLTVRYWEVIADLATDLEAAVLGMNRNRGAAFFGDGPDLVWAEILGRRGAVDLGKRAETGFGLEIRKVIDRRLGLGPGERVTTLHYQSSGHPKNPLPSLLTETTRMLKAFNKVQRIGHRLRVPYDPTTIASLLLNTVERRRSDANAFAEAGLFARPAQPIGRRIFMVAIPDRSGKVGTTGRFRDGTSTDLVTYVFPTDEADEVHFVAWETGTPPLITDLKGFESIFGQPAPGEPISSSSSHLSFGLERYLGVPVSIDYPIGR